MRRQITLFVPEPFKKHIDAVRQRFNSIQANLIEAHVTLCRDDELEDWDELKLRAHSLRLNSMTLEFDAAEREKDWVYLPVIGSADPYHQLRRTILDDTKCRFSTPHVTIIHPRNGRCTEEQFFVIRDMLPPLAIKFQQLSFIEQRAGKPWTRVVDIQLN